MFGRESTSDPLLDYGKFAKELETNIARQQEYLNKFRNVQQQQEQPNYKDYYLDLEQSYEGLNADDVNNMLQDAEFATLNNTLTNMINQETLKLVRVNLNKNQEAVNIINAMVKKVNEYKSSKAQITDNMMREMNDYLTNYSDISFKQYKELKQQGQ